MPKVLNKKHDLPTLGSTIYIGRGSPYGNPYVIGRDGDRGQVIALYHTYLLQNKELMELVRTELPGMDLVCFCAPEECHGDILLHYANSQPEESQCQ